MTKQRKIIIGGKYSHHDKFNTEYVVDKILLDASGEEETGKLTEYVLYTQTKAGIYPAGTQYVRSLKDFLSKTRYKGKIVNKFDLITSVQNSAWFGKLYDEFAPIRKEGQKYSSLQINTAIKKAVRHARKSHEKKSLIRKNF